MKDILKNILESGEQMELGLNTLASKRHSNAFSMNKDNIKNFIEGSGYYHYQKPLRDVMSSILFKLGWHKAYKRDYFFGLYASLTKSMPHVVILSIPFIAWVYFSCYDTKHFSCNTESFPHPYINGDSKFAHIAEDYYGSFDSSVSPVSPKKVSEEEYLRKAEFVFGEMGLPLL